MHEVGQRAGVDPRDALLQFPPGAVDLRTAGQDEHIHGSIPPALSGWLRGLFGPGAFNE
jgi:hypothetical protein